MQAAVTDEQKNCFLKRYIFISLSAILILEGYPFFWDTLYKILKTYIKMTDIKMRYSLYRLFLLVYIYIYISKYILIYISKYIMIYIR